MLLQIYMRLVYTKYESIENKALFRKCFFNADRREEK